MIVRGLIIKKENSTTIKTIQGKDALLVDFIYYLHSIFFPPIKY